NCGFAGRVADGIERALSTIKQEGSRPHDPPSAGLADLCAALCALYLLSARTQDALETSERAASLAEATGNRRAVCAPVIRGGLGLALGNSRREEEECAAYARAVEIADALGDSWLLGTALQNLGRSLVEADELDRGEREIRRSVAICDLGGHTGAAISARLNLSALLLTRGRWAEARSVVEQNVADSRLLGSRLAGGLPLEALGRILLLLGEREGGIRILEEALELATKFAYVPGQLRAADTLAWQEVRDG